METCETKQQLELENSQQRFTNVWSAFASTALCQESPVLLIDDLVDPRWTLTVAAALLEAGSGPVSPFVRAKAVSD